MSDDMQMNAGDEVFDFASDGIQPKDVAIVVSDFSIEEKENGTRHVLTFSGDDLPFAITVREWVQHTNPVAQRIGRGNLKKIAKGLTGSTSYSASTIVGAKGVARLGEDKDGFAKLSNFRQGSVAEGAVSLG